MVKQRTGVLEGSWLWTWRLFARWSQLDLDPLALTVVERWSVVAAAATATVRSRYIRPVTLWLQARTPAWIVGGLLERRVHSWYRIPNRRAAELVRQRFHIWPIDIGDHVRLERGQLTAVGYATPGFTEVIYVLPDGELEADPDSPEMRKAWAAYSRTR